MIIRAGLFVLALAGWEVLASLAYCALSGRLALFGLPFDQWLRVLPYARVSPWMTVLVTVSGVLGALPVIASALSAGGQRGVSAGRCGVRGRLSAASLTTTAMPPSPRPRNCASLADPAA